MKKTVLRISLTLLFCIAFCLCLSSSVFADNVAINETNFPDADFRNYVLKYHDRNGNKILDEEEIEESTYITFSSYEEDNYLPTTTLKGIEYFTALEQLSCYFTNLKELDLSSNTALKRLICSDNKLESLDIRNCLNLTELQCGNNLLTSLDVRNNTALTFLQCYGNLLRDLDITNIASLEYLACYNNSLSELDVDNNSNLQMLACFGNQLTKLNIKNCPNLLSLVDLGSISNYVAYEYQGENHRVIRYKDPTEWDYGDILSQTRALCYDDTVALIKSESEYTVFYDANGGVDAPANQVKTHDTILELTGEKPSRENSITGSYTVTLAANGGVVSSEQLTANQITSYTFKSWNTAADGSGTEYAASAEYTANADVTLYAQWNSRTETSAVTLPTPIREGDAFIGWGASLDATTGLSGKYTPTDNVTLYAVWDSDVFTVRYDANGGTDAPATQKKARYFEITLSSNKPWRNTVWPGSTTVTLDANGGSVNPANLVINPVISYPFFNWNTADDGSGDSYAPGSEYTADENVTLYAQWYRSFSNFGTKLPTPTRDNYIFKGWATDRNASSGRNDFVLPTDELPYPDVTLYAVWEAEEYTVSYDANGGTDAPESQIKTYGIDLTLSTSEPHRDDSSAGSYTVTFDPNGGSVDASSLSAARTTSYSFTNWNTAPDGTGVSYAPGESYTTNSAVTLYAHWGSSTVTDTVKLPIPTRNGYNFKGWNTDINTVAGITGLYRPNGDVTLYAIWDAVEYSVSYDGNGGTGVPDSQIKKHNTALTLSTDKPTRTSVDAGFYTVELNANGGNVSTNSLTAARTMSYSFKNWNTEANGSGTSYAPGANYTANAPVTLYAQWNNSTSTAAITLPTPTRSGYSFLGWATSSSMASGITGSYTPTGSVTLYATWEEADTFDVTRDAYSFGNSMGYFGYTSKESGNNHPIKYRPVFPLIFGENVAAEVKFRSMISKPWTGNCNGMSSSTALMNASGSISTSDFGKNNVNSLTIDDSNGEISILNFIEAMQVAQYTNQFAEAISANRVYKLELSLGSNKLDRLCTAVNAAVEQGKGTVIAIWGINGGHALLAYKMETASPTEKRMYVYDCNHPGEIRYIILNTDAQGKVTCWTYDMDNHGVWSSEGPNADYCSISYVPYETIEYIWNNRGHLYDSKEFLSYTGGNLSIMDFDGAEVATIVNGQLQTDRDDIYEIPELSLESSMPNSIFLPKGLYTVVSNDGADLELSMADGNVGASVTTSASSVTFGVDESTQENSVIVQNATQNDTYSVSLESSFAGVKYETIIVQGTGQGESISISSNNDTLSISSDTIDYLSINGVEQQRYTITAYCGAGGTISPKGDISVGINGNKLFRITPDIGYAIDSVKIDGNEIGAVSEYKFQNVLRDHTITVTFKKTYSVTEAFFDRSSNTVSVDLVNQTSAKLVCAAYDSEGQMLSVATKTVPKDSGTTSVSMSSTPLPSNITIKLFILDSRWRPLCPSFCFTV